VNFRSPFDLLSTYLGRAEVSPWTAGAHQPRPVPWLEYRAGWDSYRRSPRT
jgi:hypothetical protein